MHAFLKTGYSPVNERIAHNNAFELLDGFKLLIANCYHLLFNCQIRTQIDTKYVAWQHPSSEISRKKSILGINNKIFLFHNIDLAARMVYLNIYLIYMLKNKDKYAHHFCCSF